jgi:hypothetical protein
MLAPFYLVMENNAREKTFWIVRIPFVNANMADLRGGVFSYWKTFPANLAGGGGV